MDELRLAVVQLQQRQEAQLQAETKVADRATLARTLIFVIAGLVNLIFLDWTYRRITAAVRARERALDSARRSEEEVTRQKDLLAVTLTSIGDCVVVTDAAGRVTFLNGAAEWRAGDAIVDRAGVGEDSEGGVRFRGALHSRGDPASLL